MTDQATMERELVLRARKGDNKAFEALVRMHQQPLYRYLYRLSRDCDDAMELTQNSFVKAFISIGRFRGDSSFKTYLYKIATNTWRNTIRDKSRRRSVSLDKVDISSGSDPHDEVVRKQERRRFWDVVEGLPPRQKEALTLRVREGCSFEEVAGIMGCTTGSAKASYHHAVEKLKSVLSAEREKAGGKNPHQTHSDTSAFPFSGLSREVRRGDKQ